MSSAVPPKAPGTLSAEVERTFETPADVVWAALTRPEILSVWFTRDAQMDLRPGGAWSNGEGERGVVLEVEEPSLLRLSWDAPADCPGTRVTWRLSDPAPGSTRVHLVHDGLAGEADLARRLEKWHWAVDSLENFLKTGAGLPYGPWKDLQTELHRRAATKTFAEAEAERRAAGVVLAPIVAGGKPPRRRKTAGRAAPKPRGGRAAKPAKKRPAKKKTAAPPRAAKRPAPRRKRRS